MGTKVKGFFKGFKSLSNIFEDKDKEQELEIQIGTPTDVKHVAHIGADGSTAESPSWMNDIPSSDDSPVKKGTSNHRISKSEEITRDLPDVPKSSRHRHRSMDTSLDPDSTTKPKRTKKRRKLRGSNEKGDDVPNVPKKVRRKKPKDKDDGGSRRSTMSGVSDLSIDDIPSDA